MRRVLAFLVAMALVWGGCGDDELKEQERVEIGKILRTGLQIKQDPYVRTETLRVLEMLGDARLGKFATQCVDDPSPMVRVGAIRVLLKTGHEDADREMVGMYGRAKEPMRFALMETALELGSRALQDKLIERALRSDNLDLKKLAFQRGPLERMVEALRAKDDATIKAELRPMFSTFVSGKDTYLAAMALKKLVKMGEEDRAKPLLNIFTAKNTKKAERLRVAEILRLANVAAAREPFNAVILANDKEPEKGKLKLPIKKADPALLRAAVLGVVALGDTERVGRAQAYLSKAGVPETIEVLEALGGNPSPEVTISLKIAMKDARLRVRHRAISLYGVRPDAQARALINAMRQSDPRSLKMLANTLAKRFPQDWSEELKYQLLSEDNVDLTLKLMRDVLDQETAAKVVDPIKEQLLTLTKDKKGDRGAQAAFVLLLSAPDNADYIKLLAGSQDIYTRYVFLEHMFRYRPKESVAIFRKYFYDDLYALRLMSAAGLWRAFVVKGGKKSSAKPEEGEG